MTERAGTVVVGASIAGLTVAEGLRSRGYSDPILLVGEEQHLPYSRPPLSKQLLLADDSSVASSELIDHERLARLDIRLLSETRIVSPDLRARSLKTSSEHTLPYDALVAATGARPRRLAAAPDALVMRTRDDAAAISSAYARRGHVVILGGGVLALELATAARQRGCETTMLVRGTALTLGGAGTALSSRLLNLAVAHGVEVRFGSRVVGVDAASVVHLDDGSRLHADTVVAAVGAVPATEWLAGNGLDLSDGVLCDERGRFAPNAYAAGDVARWSDGVSPARRHEHQFNAVAQGDAVAGAIVGEPVHVLGRPSFWSDMFGCRIQVMGDIPPSAQWLTVEQDSSGQKFVFAVHDGRILHAVVGWNMPREFVRVGRLVGSPVTAIA